MGGFGTGDAIFEVNALTTNTNILVSKALATSDIDDATITNVGSATVTVADTLDDDIIVDTNVDNSDLTITTASETVTVTDSTGTNNDVTVTSNFVGTVARPVVTIDTTNDGTTTATTTSADMNLDAVAATTVVAVSSGSITAQNGTAGNDLTAATSINLTASDEIIIDTAAAEEATLKAGGTVTNSAITDNGTTDDLETLNLSTNSAHTFDITAAASVKTVNLSGDNDITVATSSDVIEALTNNLITVTNTSTGTAKLELSADAGTDAEVNDLSAVDTSVVIDLTATIANAVHTLASGATVEVSKAQTDLTFNAKDATLTNNSLTINVSDNEAANQFATADILTGDFDIVTLTNGEITADLNDNGVTTDAGEAADTLKLTTADFGAADLTINAGEGGLEIVTSLATTGALTITGSGDMDLSNANAAAVTASSLLASAVTGDISLELNGAATVQDVTTGAGDDTITYANTALSAGAYSINTGAGDDTITYDATNANDITLDLGDGIDTLQIVDGGEDLTGVTSFSMSNIEVLSLLDTDAAATISIAQFLKDTTFTLKGDATTAADTLTIEGSASNDTIDATGVTVETGDASLILLGAAGVDTINGSSAADAITGGAGVDKLYGNAGNDTFSIGEDGSNVLDFAAGEIISGGTGTDTLTFDNTVTDTTFDLTVGVVTSIETVIVDDATDDLVFAQGMGITTIDGYADGSLASITLVAGTTAYQADAEASAAAVTEAGEWFFDAETGTGPDSALTYWDEETGAAVTIDIDGTVTAAGAADSASVVANNIVVEIA